MMISPSWSVNGPARREQTWQGCPCSRRRRCPCLDKRGAIEGARIKQLRIRGVQGSTGETMRDSTRQDEARFDVQYGQGIVSKDKEQEHDMEWKRTLRAHVLSFVCGSRNLRVSTTLFQRRRVSICNSSAQRKIKQSHRCVTSLSSGLFARSIA